MERLKLITSHKGWWALIGVVAAYLVILLAQFYGSGAYDLNNLITCRKQLNYTVVWVGFFIFVGFRGTVAVAAIT